MYTAYDWISENGGMATRSDYDKKVYTVGSNLQGH